MGATFRFRCTACRYYADVGGGDDAGEQCEKTTIECVECHALRDVVTRSWFGGRSDRDERTIRCSRRASHAIRRWRRGDPCPKCGGALNEVEGIFELWD